MSSSGHYEPGDDDEVSDTLSIIPRSTRGSRAKALKSLRSSLPEESVESYTKLLQRTYLNEHDPQESNFNTTQDGIVIWTPQEKRMLYESLDRKGQSGIQDIATAIGSKSELEVQEYIRLLQKGVRRQHFNDSHTRTAVLGEIPAAAEISDQCRNTLDAYAELLGLEEQRMEDKAGKETNGSLWIIDQQVAEQLEGSSTGKENDLALDGEKAAVKAVTRSRKLDEDLKSNMSIKAAAVLFKTTRWILFSERFFMNFGGHRVEDNWVNVAFRDETPSMTADVFTSFYEIAITVTRRLVHATHLFASSRVRRKGKPSRPSARVVNSSDVRRAARTLKLKTDSSEFWLGLARRCSLDVEDIRHKRDWDPITLNYNEVEELLSQKHLPREPYERTTPPRSRSGSTTSEFTDSESVSDPEDDHAEALDQQHSFAEERLCWSALGQPPPTHLTQLSLAQLPPRPFGKRKRMEELVDWRDRLLYRSEWEEYGYEAEKLESEFEAQLKKPRLTTSFRRLSSRPISSILDHSHIEDPQTATEPEPEPELENKDQPNPDYEYQTEDSDPEFRPKSPVLAPKSSMSRTSTRRRTPVSYAPPQLLDSDTEMAMEMDIDQESNNAEDDHSNVIPPVNEEPTYGSDEDEDEDEDKYDEEDEEEALEFSSTPDNALPEPQERAESEIPPSEDEDDDLYPSHHLPIDTHNITPFH
ncbi:hypothetical protein BJY04DRAFT_222947 [Aspergillus karnatakaensis]|uniref:uncharacterized protein n=1 Tax=Aspergillus karnatakaensis TaxID=1810916 RepID=UPI003CCE2D56